MKATNRCLSGLFASCFLILANFVSSPVKAADVEQWGVWEISLDGPRDGNPYLEVQLSATFSLGNQRVVVPGFYDGDGVYKVRFSPPAQGEWRYETQSNRPELSGKTSSCTAGPPSADNHGPVRVFKTFYLRYADGSPYHQFGTTCYAWIHQTEKLQQQTLKTLIASPFNKIRFCIFPFCLQRNTSGIDLVSHPDGRLRLAVNQWPDRVQNDSSPGKLIVGKWTRFAVTYDGTKTADNVAWYFSRPQDQPGEAALALDRKTTYNAGPVAGGIGPLVIGNFNATMHSHGLDRQFRGQIRGLEIYGSRISGRGALPLARINGR